MSLLEDEPHRIVDLIQASSADTNASMVAGITGPSGVGKSTLTDTLIAEFRARNRDRAIGVIAVDPSSPITGGAILGDRVRMMKHATDPGIFIRSLASRGHLGGLSLGTSGVSRVMQLMGCDQLIIETVGVGQNQVEILQQADLVLVVLSAGLGDGMQMLKAGLLEIGDVFVVNKADRPGADEMHGQLKSMIEITKECGSTGPPLLADPVSATEGTGVPRLVDLLENLAGERERVWRAHRQTQAEQIVRRVILETASRMIETSLDDGGAAYVKRVLEQGKPLTAVAEELVQKAAGKKR
jgi:LAO/AO transport system kinase